jgi:hypothetical protein
MAAHTQTNTQHERAHTHGSAQFAGEAWGSGGSREEGCKTSLGLVIDKNAYAANAHGHVRTHGQQVHVC